MPAAKEKYHLHPVIWNGPLFMEPYENLSNFLWTIFEENKASNNGLSTRLTDPVYVVIVDVANIQGLP